MRRWVVKQIRRSDGRVFRRYYFGTKFFARKFFWHQRSNEQFVYVMERVK